MTYKRGFTLIELLVVIAILAVLSAAVTIVLNPNELLAQARDGTRISDIGTINKALSLYSQQNSTPGGNANTVYISIPDPSSSTCADITGLPTLPTPWVYNCATPQNLKRTDSTGWIPVNFGMMSGGSPLSVLPLDPINSAASNEWYSYIVSNSGWLLESQSLESVKYIPLAVNDGGTQPIVYEIGSSLNIGPASTIVCDSYTTTSGFQILRVGAPGDSNEAASQTFTGNGKTLVNAQFQLFQRNSPTGNAVAKIYAISGTYGTNAIPTGSPLATSDPVSVASLSPNPAYGLATFNFSGSNRIVLTNGAYYAITFEYGSGGIPYASSDIGLEPNNTGTHPGNAGTENFSNVWAPMASGTDLIFTVNTVAGS
jgi:prepilin-type N-terminal cleavage/methylation domain-containing protein